MIIVCQKLLAKTRITGITIFPFIFLKNRSLRLDPVLINHERIHLRQQLELLIVFFYLFYVVEYYIRLLRLRNAYQAYRTISFEREAFEHENDLGYLKKRRFWSFVKYL
ncbi:MAG: hypothetical protein EAS48_02170 [Chryseobacterium sp.]|nr:MAG: hypothetical protein EAS48_02170 [Chryseobacterium sp.]